MRLVDFIVIKMQRDMRVVGVLEISNWELSSSPRKLYYYIVYRED